MEAEERRDVDVVLYEDSESGEGTAGNSECDFDRGPDQGFNALSCRL